VIGWGEPLRLAAACEDEASGERKRKGAQQESEGKKQGAAVLSDKVRDFPLPLLRFIDPGGVALPESHAPHTLNCRQPHLPLTGGPYHAETTRHACVRYHYGAATEGPWRPVTSAPYVAHYARGCAA
jgi:hypothetical protein